MKRVVGILFKALAFIRRDFLIETSYRSAFVLQFGGVLVSVGIWYFLSGMISGATVREDGGVSLILDINGLLKTVNQVALMAAA